jgi:hypothetical protein
MGIMKIMFTPFSVIEDVEYYAIGTVSTLINKSTQTLRLWDVYSDDLEEQGKERLIPSSTRIGKNYTRCWTEDEIVKIAEFSNNLGYGDIAEYSRTRWGEKGKNIKQDRSTKAREEKKSKRKQIDRQSKKLQEHQKLQELEGVRKSMLKGIRKRARQTYKEMNIDADKTIRH